MLVFWLKIFQSTPLLKEPDTFFFSFGLLCQRFPEFFDMFDCAFHDTRIYRIY